MGHVDCGTCGLCKIPPRAKDLIGVDGMGTAIFKESL